MRIDYNVQFIPVIKFGTGNGNDILKAEVWQPGTEVPMDMVVNAVIAAMAMHGISGISDINVYQIGFEIGNAQKLRDEMCEEEKKMYGFEVEGINWKEYFCSIHIPGLRNHVLKK
ncbi:Fatty acyl-CoA reductase 2 [Senna tora]|uniref:Fatty acyl-CoA reductase 2 n=1 Tax=Senna tora TaxID=362788 RepID=A0A834X0J9_9FABA|nr:Fatty acyl-CoA reductase 2 [Senna tora]